MKLHSELLKRYIQLPSEDLQVIRSELDSLGLEVKDVNGGVYTIETLANRGDHLYHLGVAREFSARFLIPIKYPHIASELPERKPSVIVRRETPACLSYALLEVEVTPGFVAPSSVTGFTESKEGRHGIVDVLNFVQLELGQPMHAFDKDKIEGEISIVVTTSPQEVDALDGKRYTVPEDSIVIRDSKKIIAVAGVIGCSNSMVTSGTGRVLIESATFDPVYIRKTAKKMGISTDASFAFERGTDQASVVPALKRALLLSEGEAQSARAIGFLLSESPYEPKKISLSMKYLKREMNAPRLPDVEIIARLKNLGFHVESQGDELMITVPSWRRWDISTREDMVEELARSRGLSEIKLELPELDTATPERNIVERCYQSVGPVLSSLGFSEVITRSFFPQKFIAPYEKCGGTRENLVTLLNSVEAENATLKPTNIFHIAHVVQQNMKSGETSVKVFEIGRVFLKDCQKDFQHEEEVLSIACGGRIASQLWKEEETIEAKLQHFIGVVQTVVGSFGRDIRISEGTNPFLHPQGQGEVYVGRKMLGSIGVIHPEIHNALESKEKIFVAHLSVKELVEIHHDVSVCLPSEFPSITRDLTFFLPTKSFAGKMKLLLEKDAPEFLRSVQFINDYTKEGEDKRRCSYRFIFQHAERTLQHEEVDTFMNVCIARAREKGFELV